MAKKKVESRKKKAALANADEARAALAPVTGDANEAPYEVGTWSGMPLYKCKLCRFDTLSAEKIVAHLEEHRLGKIPRQATPPGEGEPGEVFEVELKEIDSTVDADGNVHKTYTVKE